MHESKCNVFFNNCKHFATDCTTGESNSQQFENGVTATGASLIALAGLAAVETTIFAAGLLSAISFPATAMLPPVTIARDAVFGVSKKL